jgi:hypothetical protein
MRITKQNYNELRTQELDNNFAKVWHVNEIREELLENTPTGGVTDITNGDVEYSESVALGTSDFSIISTDYKIQVQDNGVNGFNLISKVPYHEVIGTITIQADTGDSTPTLNVQVNTALAEYDLVANTFTRATWDIETYEPESGVKAYRLKMTNKVSTLYYGGIFNTSLFLPINIVASSAIPHQLNPISIFNGESVSMCVLLSYVSGSENLRTRLTDLNNNPEMIFKFHLILPID